MAAASASTLTRGHFRSLELLEDTLAARETLVRYERALGAPVYLRPTDKGLTVISLEPKPRAMVGVGPASGGCNLTALPPSEDRVASAVAGYRAKVAGMKRRSPEERYVIERFRRAVGSGLQLDRDLLFLHQEWRFRSAGKLDVLALDQTAGQLVVIEVKQSEALALDPATAAQGYAYVDRLTAAWDEHIAYIQRLACALAGIYELRSMPSITAKHPPRVEVWWPGGSRRVPAR